MCYRIDASRPNRRWRKPGFAGFRAGLLRPNVSAPPARRAEPPAAPKEPRSAGRSGLHRFRLNKVQPTSTLNQNWRELIFANPRADPTLAGRFGRLRPARRAGPLRHRWGLARRADPARADPGLAERSASSGQKRTASLFTFEDRETSPAFDQALCSDVGRSAQAESSFKPKNRRNRSFLSMTVCIMFAGIGRAGVPRPAATSTRTLSVTRRSTPCAPPPTTRRERVAPSAAPCSPHAPPSLSAPSSLPSPSARFANAPRPITVWADLRVGSFCIEPDMEIRLAPALQGRRPTVPDSRFAPARLARTHPHPAPRVLRTPQSPARPPQSTTRPRTPRPPPPAHPLARSHRPPARTLTATRTPAAPPPQKSDGSTKVGRGQLHAVPRFRDYGPLPTGTTQRLMDASRDAQRSNSMVTQPIRRKHHVIHV